MILSDEEIFCQLIQRYVFFIMRIQKFLYLVDQCFVIFFCCSPVEGFLFFNLLFLLLRVYYHAHESRHQVSHRFAGAQSVLMIYRGIDRLDKESDSHIVRASRKKRLRSILNDAIFSSAVKRKVFYSEAAYGYIGIITFLLMSHSGIHNNKIARFGMKVPPVYVIVHVAAEYNAHLNNIFMAVRCTVPLALLRISQIHIGKPRCRIRPKNRCPFFLEKILFHFPPHMPLSQRQRFFFANMSL